MWIYSKRRNEHDNRFLLNLDLCSRINLTQLGEKWFIEVMLGTEAYPVAFATSQEEVADLIQRIFESLKAGEKALDLETSGHESTPFTNPSPPLDYPAKIDA